MTPQTPLPETFVVPASLVNKWTSLPSGLQIGGSLTKQDWENLLSALDHTIAGSSAVQGALISYSNEDTEAANAQSWEASRRLIEAQNKMRQFMTGLITSVV